MGNLSLFEPEPPPPNEWQRQRQNLLNALYRGFDVWKRIYAEPEYRALSDAYGNEVVTNSSATPLAKSLSDKLSAKRAERQDAIAQAAVDRIDALPDKIITAVSNLIDAGIRQHGAKYRYPDFDELLRQAKTQVEGV